MDKPTLIYFPARGRAEIIRLVLAEAGADWQEHHVGKGTPPVDGRPTDLAELTARGDLPFGAVPVWEEPGLRLAQSAAIANHLARRHGLNGRDAVEQAKVEEWLGAVEDVRMEVRKLHTAAPGDRPAVRAELAERALPRWLGHLDRLLRANGGGDGFVVGAGLTIADLALWYLLEVLRDNRFGPAIDRYPALVAFAARVGSRPRLAAYARSPRRPALTPLPG